MHSGKYSNFEIVKDYIYLDTVLTNKNELRPEIGKELQMQIEHIMDFCTKESVSIQSRTYKNL